MWKTDKLTMQNWTGCDDLQQHDTIELSDSRDNNMYTISKLKDGNCWMTQNLRLVNKTISSDDSAMESGSFTIPASDINNFVTSEDEAPAVYYDGNTSHGAYYDWYTATAGSGTKSVTDGDVANSICPKGWHLPLQSEYKTLYDAYPSNGLMVDANGPKYTAFGYVYNKAVQTDTYIYSYYWSSTACYDDIIYGADPYYAYNLYTYTSSSSSGSSVSNHNRYYGGLIRCLAGGFPGQKHAYNITYNANGGSSTPNPQTGVTYNDSLNLQYTYISRGGYEFLGWCTVNPGSSTSCSGQLYEDGGSIPLTSENNNITLYATWRIYPSASSFSCSSLSVGGSTALNYNNQTIWVYKAKNNTCWTDGSTRGTWSEVQAANGGCPSGFRWASQSDMQAIINAYSSESYCGGVYTYIGGGNSWVSSTSNYTCYATSSNGACTLSCASRPNSSGYTGRCIKT